LPRHDALPIGSVPRAAARGQGSAPGPRPLFCKKAGQKTFTGLDFCQPEPLALGASDEISPRSGHLSGRVAAPTRVGEVGGSRNLTGAPPPQRRFSLGLHPVSLGKTKEMGWNRQHQRKTEQQRTGEFLKPNVLANLEPRPYGDTRRAWRVSTVSLTGDVHRDKQ